jgi:hypothetical protein
MPSPLPRWNRKVHLSLSSSAISAFPEIMAGRLPHHVFRGLLSVHSRYGLHTHQVTFMTLYTGGFSRFVTSTTAPIATGWNESCRAGFAPAGKPCLCTAHMIKDVIIDCRPLKQHISAPFPEWRNSGTPHVTTVINWPRMAVFRTDRSPNRGSRQPEPEKRVAQGQILSP